ncbi:DUF3142 domain-containing protein [Acinetobacter rudis]|uniref:DUF3142 domain-containing protein n=1 Tax=Acinetobacter rudis TaxID=632955 RepID=UPI00039B2BE7|nr:DUF3142 domain-containing protein [Acinetobacter rudis]
MLSIRQLLCNIRYIIAAIFGCLTLIFALCFLSPPAMSTPTHIDANQYDAFWIWGDIRSAPYLYQAETLYILQGDFSYHKRQQKIILQPQGIAAKNLAQQQIWLVFRNHDLNWSEEHFQMIIRRLNTWRNHGNDVVGVQIDFDSKTQALYEYGLFLQKLRQHLPNDYQISITGLLDWTNMQDDKTLKLLKDNIDELVIQSYQGRHTIENYQDYLKRISNMGLPYKIGLVQHGQWNKQLDFRSDPHFRGYVVFLLKD